MVVSTSTRLLEKTHPFWGARRGVHALGLIVRLVDARPPQVSVVGRIEVQTFSVPNPQCRPSLRARVARESRPRVAHLPLAGRTPRHVFLRRMG